MTEGRRVETAVIDASFGVALVCPLPYSSTCRSRMESWLREGNIFNFLALDNKIYPKLIKIGPFYCPFPMDGSRDIKLVP